MKIILFALIITAFASCSNTSNQKKIYEDSANYYSNKMTEITDAGYSSVDSIYQKQKTDYFIYQTKRKYYIDKMKEAKK